MAVTTDILARRATDRVYTWEGHDGRTHLNWRDLHFGFAADDLPEALRALVPVNRLTFRPDWVFADQQDLKAFSRRAAALGLMTYSPPPDTEGPADA